MGTCDGGIGRNVLQVRARREAAVALEREMKRTREEGMQDGDVQWGNRAKCAAGASTKGGSSGTGAKRTARRGCKMGTCDRQGAT